MVSPFGAHITTAPLSSYVLQILPLRLRLRLQDLKDGGISSPLPPPIVADVQYVLDIYRLILRL